MAIFVLSKLHMNKITWYSYCE